MRRMTHRRKIYIGYALAALAVIFVAWWQVKDAYLFASPHLFYLLFLLPLLMVYDIWAEPWRKPRVKLSTLSLFPETGRLKTGLLMGFPRFLRYLALAAIIIAVARPQSRLSWQNTTTEGIDIVIAMDISASMLAKDFEPNRLDAAKEVAAQFIQGRPNDRMGLVVYEGEAFTQCPLTTDHRVLLNLLGEIRTGMIEGGTAIGMGLATSVNRLRESDAKSRVVILLTDGDNNAGSISPLTAAEIAKSMGVRVYSIGVGTHGRALSPVAIYPDGSYKYEYLEVKIDEKTLQQIAEMTDGAYFRATDRQSLAGIYSEIDKLEKTKIQVTEHSQRSEEFYLFAWIGLGLLGIEYLLKYLFLRTLT